MFNLACAFVAIMCFVFCGVCVHRCDAAKRDRDEYRENWFKAVEDLGKAVKLNDDVIKIAKEVNDRCQQLITYNDRLTDINADLRLELNKMKEKPNEEIQRTTDSQ